MREKCSFFVSLPYLFIHYKLGLVYARHWLCIEEHIPVPLESLEYIKG